MQDQQKPTTPPTQSAALSPNAQPKLRFIQNPTFVSNHKNMVDSAAFERGSDSAMAQFALWCASTVTNDDTAKAAGYRLQGAQEFLGNFKLLAETPKPAPSPNRDDNLVHLRG